MAKSNLKLKNKSKNRTNKSKHPLEISKRARYTAASLLIISAIIITAIPITVPPLQVQATGDIARETPTTFNIDAAKVANYMLAPNAGDPLYTYMYGEGVQFDFKCVVDNGIQLATITKCITLPTTTTVVIEDEFLAPVESVYIKENGTKSTAKVDIGVGRHQNPLTDPFVPMIYANKMIPDENNPGSSIRPNFPDGSTYKYCKFQDSVWYDDVKKNGGAGYDYYDAKSETDAGDTVYLAEPKGSDVNIKLGVFKIPVGYIASGTSNANGAFTSSTAAKFSNIEITPNLLGIGDYAFYGCTNLSNVTIGKNVNIIGVSAFEGCTGLGEIKFASSGALAAIADQAFYGCSKLSTVEIPETVKGIGSKAFARCAASDTGLREVKFLSTALTQTLKLGNSVFAENTELKKIILPPYLDDVGSNTFYDCKNLESVRFDESYGKGAGKNLTFSQFGKCPSLLFISVPNKDVDMTAPTSVQSGSIPDWDDFIGNDTGFFFESTDSESTSTPRSKLRQSAWDHGVTFKFYDKSNYYGNNGDVDWSKGTYEWLDKNTDPLKDNFIYQGKATETGKAKISKIIDKQVSVGGIDKSRPVKIPDTIGPFDINEIANTAFDNLRNDIVKVTIPSFIAKLGTEQGAVKGVFADCPNLTYLYFEDAATDDLEYVAPIPELSIGGNAFKTGGTELHFYNVPVGTSPFNYAMNSSNVLKDKFYEYITIHTPMPQNLEIKYNKDTKLNELIAYPQKKDFDHPTNIIDAYPERAYSKENYPYDKTSYTDPSDSESAYWAWDKNFAGTGNDILTEWNKSVKEISLPYGVWSIATGLFMNNVDVTKITAPGLQKLEDRTFEGCTQLNEISFLEPNSADTPNENGFLKFTPKMSGSRIVGGVIYGLSNGKEIKAIECLEKTGGNKSIAIPDTVTELGTGIFKNCKGIEEISIPGTIAVIPNEAFNDSGLKKLILRGASSVRMNDNAFQRSGDLFDELELEAQKTTSLFRDIFGDNPKADEDGMVVNEDSTKPYYNWSAKISAKTVTVSFVYGQWITYSDVVYDGMPPASEPAKFSKGEPVKAKNGNSFDMTNIPIGTSINPPSDSDGLPTISGYIASWNPAPNSDNKINISEDAYDYGSTGDNYRVELIYIPIPPDNDKGSIYNPDNLDPTKDSNCIRVTFMGYYNRIVPIVVDGKSYAQQYVKDGSYAVEPDLSTVPTKNGKPAIGWLPSPISIKAKTDSNGIMIKGTALPINAVYDTVETDVSNPDDPSVDADDKVTVTFLDYHNNPVPVVVNGKTLYHQYIKEGKNATPPNNNSVPTPDGQRFLTWEPANAYINVKAASSTGTGTGSTGNTGTKVKTSINITAKYEPGSAAGAAGTGPFSVTFIDYQNKPIPVRIANGSIVSTQKVKGGENAVIPTNKDIPVPSGQVFKSWATTEFIDVTKDAMVLAVYEAKTGSDGSGGSGSGSSNGGNSSVAGSVGTNTVLEINKPGFSDTGVANAVVAGSTDNFVMRITDDTSAKNEAEAALLADTSSMQNILYFPMDISLYDATGETKITDTTGLSVTITLPIPDQLRPYGGNVKAAHIANGHLEPLPVTFKSINGVPCISFVAKDFSPYVLYVDTNNLVAGESEGGIGANPGSGLDSTPKTGDLFSSRIYLGAALIALAFVLIFMPGKKKKVIA